MKLKIRTDVIFLFAMLMSSCGFSEKYSTVIFNGNGLTFNNGPRIEFEESLDSVIKKMGEPDSYDRDPSGEDFIYQNICLDVYVNFTKQVQSLILFLFSPKNDGEVEMHSIKRIWVDNLEIYADESFQTVKMNLEEKKMPYKIKSSPLSEEISLTLNNERKLRMFFLKKYNSKLYQIQYWK